jgi:hypothetical protein
MGCDAMIDLDDAWLVIARRVFRGDEKCTGMTKREFLESGSKAAQQFCERAGSHARRPANFSQGEQNVQGFDRRDDLRGREPTNKWEELCIIEMYSL